MEKRSFTKYLFLNCLTLGIYGFITGSKMDDEINLLCKGDNQKPGVSYTAAVFIRLIPIFGLIYFNYWWYQQNNRVKLNGNRYGINVKESGTDMFLMRTVLKIPLFLGTVFVNLLAMIVPLVLGSLFALISPIFTAIFMAICWLILGLFSGELTAGAAISNYYLIKNLNRFADVYHNGAAPFEPMAYEYYPSVESKYPNYLPNMINGAAPSDPYVNIPGDEGKPQRTDILSGSLIGVKGTCAGYSFDLNSGEEIIIGKDAKVSMIVIDPAYKEISRKHVGVCYDITRDQYRVVDYSSNGTWANGIRMDRGQAVYLPHSTELKLANDKNIFLLG